MDDPHRADSPEKQSFVWRDQSIAIAPAIRPNDGGGRSLLKRGEAVSIEGNRSVRVVEVLVATDQEFRRNFEWKNDVAADLDAVSCRYVRNFNIAFKVTGWMEWDSGESANDIQELFNRGVDSVGVGDAEVVLLFSGKDLPRAYRTQILDAGTARYFWRYALIRVNPKSDDWEYRRDFIVHEIAHLFGAWHTEDTASVMRLHPVRGVNCDFDPQCCAVISRFRDFDFSRGTEQLTKADIDWVTAKFKQSCVHGEPHPVASALEIEARREWRSRGLRSTIESKLVAAESLLESVEGVDGVNTRRVAKLLADLRLGM